MVHEGVFGEVLHAEAAYLHDLREILFENRDEGLWRRAWHTRSNSNLYPTHGLGPVSWYLDIHAGDRFDYLVSVSTPGARTVAAPRGDGARQVRSQVAREVHHRRPQHDAFSRRSNGKTVMLQHDVSNARPYTRHNRVMGTKGTFEDYPPRIYVEGPAGGERWNPIDEWKTKFEHPLWTKLGEQARTRRPRRHGLRHGVPARRVHARRDSRPTTTSTTPPTWSAPFPLSEMSVAKGSAPMKFPDFTRGEWNDASRASEDLQSREHSPSFAR